MSNNDHTHIVGTLSPSRPQSSGSPGWQNLFLSQRKCCARCQRGTSVIDHGGSWRRWWWSYRQEGWVSTSVTGYIIKETLMFWQDFEASPAMLLATKTGKLSQNITNKTCFAKPNHPTGADSIKCKITKLNVKLQHKEMKSFIMSMVLKKQ